MSKEVFQQLVKSEFQGHTPTENLATNDFGKYVKDKTNENLENYLNTTNEGILKTMWISFLKIFWQTI